MSRRQLTKHTTYYELLDAVREADGCPLCHIEMANSRRYLDSVMHESVNDPGVRAALTRSGGYCHRHAHCLRGRGNGLGIAILYQDQVKLILRQLDRVQAMPLAGGRMRASAAQDPQTCPACRSQNECRSRYGSTLIQWIDDGEMRSALEASRGFCVPHFQALLQMPMDTKARTVLVEMQRERMEALLSELEEFCRKHDYRFSSEGFGSESDSWSRAIRTMVGEEDAF
jgi:hypothetical protein